MLLRIIGDLDQQMFSLFRFFFFAQASMIEILKEVFKNIFNQIISPIYHLLVHQA